MGINIIYSNSIKSHVYGALAKLFCRRTTIWHVRDNIKKGLMHTALISLADKIVCISAFTYQQLNGAGKKKELVYGGIDCKDWNPAIVPLQNIRVELALSPGTRLVANISQITPWKNHIDFIDAARIIIEKFNNVHFLIIGDILNPVDLKYKIQIQGYIRQLNLNSHFSFLNYRTDVKELLKQIDVLIHTAIEEPFGRVLIEAMAMEIPVVAFNSGGPKEIVEDNETGYLVETHDFREIAEETIHLLQNDELRKSFGRAGRQKVIMNFSIERYTREMERIFEPHPLQN